ncbi:3-oxoacyl-[acyl-carrier-protein] reductase FabG [termite gut metagenome]|uniref:3-oxoacyl-[acyl-carrier-protein] reductase FabG n=1 Tax=termite gut metagenome TaxID=433724 RepID=A0A5J4QR26_9ZZZZ
MNILITGGSSGLGKATVELLASDQLNNVYFTYNRHKDEAMVLANKFRNVHALEVDFTNDAHINRLLENMSTMDLDVLINNAYVGLPQNAHFHKIRAEEFLCGFKNNLIPTIRITQEALLVFKKKRFGKIVNVLTASLYDLPPIGYSIYVGNKAYLQELSKVWNKEYTRYNIVSNCIAPEYMQTNFSDVDERILEQMQMQHPLKRLLTTEEVAYVIKFLIESSQQLNGVTIPINAAKTVT